MSARTQPGIHLFNDYTWAPSSPVSAPLNTSPLQYSSTLSTRRAPNLSRSCSLQQQKKNPLATRIKQREQTCGGFFFSIFTRGRCYTMQIKKLKVRPQKSALRVSLPTLSCTCLLLTLIFIAFLCVCATQHDIIFIIYSLFTTVIDQPVVLCGPQLASMLGCWAATKDVKSIGPCREHAETLFECMRTAVRFSPLASR